MFFYFGKIAVLLFGPLGIAIILLLAALVLYRGSRWGRLILAGGILILWLFSTQLVSQAMLRGLEGQERVYSPDSAPREPAIIVLGGFLRPPTTIHKEGELTGGGDRLVEAFRLYHAGKAPLILVSGGDVPMFGKGAMTESEAARILLEEWGVPDSAILVESHSKNTVENARFSHDLLAARGIHTVLLVTSAYHMPRAAGVFRKTGLEVIPVAADHQTGWPEPDIPFRVLPETGALSDSATAFKEYIGLFVYRLRGWV